MSYLNKEQIQNIVDYAKHAGDIAVQMQQSPSLEVNKKPDGSKVTSADVAVSQFFDEKLKAAFPNIPIICEEGTLRQAHDIFWLIDPIDGTSSYANGQEQFAINIALIQNKKPTFGLIYAPLFEGGKLAFTNADGTVTINKEKSRLSVQEQTQASPTNTDIPLTIVASSRIKNTDVQNFTTQYHPQHQYHIEKLSSAVKFFRIIEGTTDLYLHCRPSMEWDIASGQALIELMGGQVKILSSNNNQFAIGDDMSYNKPNFANMPFIASLNKDLVNG